jgi:hypothetical protein
MVLLFLVSLQTLYEARSGRLQTRKSLKSYAELCVQRLEKWQRDLEFALITLVEQREIREGIAGLNAESATTAWAQGFLEALDGATRSIMVSHPGVENLTFRALDGARLAGSGAGWDSIAYPDLRMRTLRQEIRKEPDLYRERIVVPVRAADASPVAFLAAEIHLKGFYKAVFTELESESDTIILLADDSGKKIWSNNNDPIFPDLQPDLREFEHNRQVYLVESAVIPGTGRMLYAALPQHAASAVFSPYFVRNIAAILIVILLIWSCESMPRWRKGTPHAQGLQ